MLRKRGPFLFRAVVGLLLLSKAFSFQLAASRPLRVSTPDLRSELQLKSLRSVLEDLLVGDLPHVENVELFQEKGVGQGSYGVLCEGLVNNGNDGPTKIVAKKKNKDKFSEEYQKLEEFINSKVQTACAEYVAPYIGSATIGGEKWLCWRDVGRKNLEDFLVQGDLGALGAALKMPGATDDEICAVILIQLLECIKALHEQGIVHRDIKPENILVDQESGRLRLIDFGSAADMKATIKRGYDWSKSPCDPLYAAPELFLDEAHPFKFDLWSVGAIFLRAAFPALRRGSGGEAAGAAAGGEAGGNAFAAFVAQLAEDGHDLNLWLDRRAGSTVMEAGVEEGLRFLSTDGGRWWRLAAQLVRRAPDQRPTAAAALAAARGGGTVVQREEGAAAAAAALGRLTSCPLVDDSAAVVKVDLARPMGLLLEENAPGEARGLYVLEVNPGSPADRARVQVADQLMMVRDTDVRAKTFDEVMGLIAGCPRGQQVPLTFERPGAAEVVRPAAAARAAAAAGAGAAAAAAVEPVDFGACSLQGKRSGQEDAIVLQAFCVTPPDGVPTCLYIGAVFDGHCGSEASRAAADALPGILRAAVADSFVPDLMGAAMVELVWDRLKRDPRVTATKGGGSTATIVLVLDDGTAYFLNCGDSRAVLTAHGDEGNGPKTVVQFATQDHCASSESEILRVKSEGGEVDCIAGKYRVVCGDWKLTVARNIGAKKWRKYAVSDKVDISSVKLSKTNDAIIVASDGVWSTVGSAAAALLVGRWRAEEGLGAGAAAARLCEEAVREGSIDNTSAVVLYLG